MGPRVKTVFLYAFGAAVVTGWIYNDVRDVGTSVGLRVASLWCLMGLAYAIGRGDQHASSERLAAKTSADLAKALVRLAQAERARPEGSGR